jgi:glycosyltransferase involved in cell wall biosynthesis
MRGLRERGVPQLLVAREGGEQERRAREDGFDVRALRMDGVRSLLVPRRLARVVREVRPAVLHAHTSRAHGWVLLAARAGGADRPRVVVSRRVDFSIYRHSFLRLNRWKYVRGVDRILCVSRRVRAVLIADGIPPELLEVVHSGVDLARIDGAPDRRAALRAEMGVPDGAPLVGNVGHCVDHKGQRWLVEAAPILFANHPEARIAIVGDGPLLPALRAQAASLGVADRVLFLGERGDVPSLLRAFDAFAFPSHLEGLGTSVLDAMAARLPVVAADGGGVGEMIDAPKNGLLVPPRDASALARALDWMLGHPDDARRMAAAGRERVEREFTADRMVEGTLAAYARPTSSR